MAQESDVAMAEQNQWSGVEDTIEDPEEFRVIFQALDSFALVYFPLHRHRT